MISLQEISIFPKDFCLEVFSNLFSRKDDNEGIKNFLLCDYYTAVEQFEWKVKNLKNIQESIFFVYDKGNNIIGYCSVYPNRWNISFLNNEIECGLFVRKEDRGKGLGTEILNQLEEYIKLNLPNIERIVLSPLITNTKAISLYEKLGFDHGSNSLALSQDMLYMVKEIDKTTKKQPKQGQIELIKAKDMNYILGKIITSKHDMPCQKLSIFNFSKNQEKYSFFAKYIAEANIFNFNDISQASSGISLLLRSYPAYNLILIDGISRLYFENALEKDLIDQIFNKPKNLHLLVFDEEYPLDPFEKHSNIITIINTTENL